MPFGTKVSKWRCENRKIMFGFLAFFSQVIFFTIVFFFCSFEIRFSFWTKDILQTEKKSDWHLSLSIFPQMFVCQTKFSLLVKKVPLFCTAVHTTLEPLVLYRCVHYAEGLLLYTAVYIAGMPFFLYRFAHYTETLIQYSDNLFFCTSLYYAE